MFALVVKALEGGSISQMKRANSKTTVAYVRLVVEQCAVSYCGAPNTEPATIDECIRFVFAQYGMLNPDEIKEAFRLAASGKTSASLEAYHGQFTARILGGVLSNYLDYRSALAREARSRQAAAEAEEAYRRRQDDLFQQHGTAADQIAALDRGKHKTWNDLPGWLAMAAVKDGLIDLTMEEKGEAWRTAKAYVVNRIAAMLLDPDRSVREKWLRAAEAIRKDPDTFPEVLRPEAEIVYAKMLLFSKI